MINERLYKAMNEQIRNELESYYIYVSMAAYFHARNLDGMAHWMRCQAHEEMIHAMKFFDHIHDRGGKVVLMNLKQIKTEWTSVREVWQDTYEHEQFITGKINELTAISREEKDYTSEPLLSWFSNEQLEEESTSGKVLEQIKMVGDNQTGILLLDRELGARAFSPGSPLDPTAYSVAT
ncbi:MAG: ferritin [Deltaproteobacteria bacterium]|nr:ferritin [Deltaproteobacteria bacterium]